MWYPLRKSVYSLSLASAILMAIVLTGQPIDSSSAGSRSSSPASGIDAAAISLGATALADRLPLENDAQRHVARAALSAASLLLIAKLEQQQAQINSEAIRLEAATLEANGASAEGVTVNRQGRSGTAMPFFSFARWVSPGQERGS